MSSPIHPFDKTDNAQQIAKAVILKWHEVELGLSPIIGRQGVMALYKRSIQLASRIYPWLADTDRGINFSALKTALEQQTSENVLAAGNSVLQIFCDLLTTLLGSALTERLLLSVWTNSFVQEIGHEQQSAH